MVIIRASRDYKHWLYEQKYDNITTLIRYFHKIGEGHVLNIFTLVTPKQQSLKEVIGNWTPDDYSVSVSGDDDDFTIKVGKKDRFGKISLGKVRIIKNDSFYLAISDEPSHFIKNVLRRFFDLYYPEISRIFYSSFELKDFLEKLEERTQGQIVADRIVATRRFTKEERWLKRIEKSVTYTGRPFRDAFRDAIENDQWIDKIKFRLFKVDKEELSAYLSREGLFRCTKNFSVFYQTVLSDIAKLVSKKVSLYSGRSRLEEKKPKPIIVEFDLDIFKDVSQNRKFIDSLAKMPFESVSVYHSNPYIHLSLVDYLDGSSYDVWVVAFNKITIVPQLRSSFASLARLINHIFEKFREGEVKDYGGFE